MIIFFIAALDKIFHLLYYNIRTKKNKDKIRRIRKWKNTKITP